MEGIVLRVGCVEDFGGVVRIGVDLRAGGESLLVVDARTHIFDCARSGCT